MSNCTLSIVVISYNTKEMTLECLRSVFSETRDVDYEVIVLDNASEDGSVAAIEIEFGDSVKLIKSQINLGFAAGNNYATKNSHSDYLLLLNPDTVVLDRAIDNLYRFSKKNPDAGIWGGKTLFRDGSLNPSSCWSQQTLWSLLCQAIGLTSLFRGSSIFNSEGLGGWDHLGVRQVDIVSGCFFLIRRDLWELLSGFQDIFFMYGEEADLCLRAREFGVHPMVTSDATIIHYGGGSEKIRSDKLVRLLKAKMLLIREHFPRNFRLLGYRLLFLWPVSRKWAHAFLVLAKLSSPEKFGIWKEVVNRSNEWLINDKD